MSEYDYLDRDGLERPHWDGVEMVGPFVGPPQPTHLTRMRQGAALLGISLEAYLEHRERGEAWCGHHRAWEPAERFAPKKGRAIGALAGSCREGHAADVRERKARKRAAARKEGT